VVVGTDTTSLQRCLEDALEGRLRSRPADGPRFGLRVRGVPVAMLTKVEHLVTRLDGDLKLVSQRVVASGAYSLTLDLEVEGKALQGSSWTLSGVGAELVVFQRRELRRRAVVPIMKVQPESRLPPPRRPLTAV